jgi:hypothetical protein
MVRGLGDAATDAQLAQLVGSGASIGTPAALTAAGLGASSGATILGMSAAAAIPVIGAAIAGVTLLASYLIAHSGCGPTCIQTSDYANKAEDLLRTNEQEYLALPAPRTQLQQQAALANFDAIWAQLVQLCSDPAMGNAGKACISDRQAGACKWQNAGQCWNWFSGYRDPIANDQVVPDTATTALQTSVQPVTQAVGTALQSVGVSANYAPLLLIGLGVLVVWMVVK